MAFKASNMNLGFISRVTQQPPREATGNGAWRLVGPKFVAPEYYRGVGGPGAKFYTEVIPAAVI